MRIKYEKEGMKRKKMQKTFNFQLSTFNFFVPLHSQIRLPKWWNGRHEGLKIPWP